jgi:hypothetical protein
MGNDNDHVALMAARKATEIVQRSGATWEQIIGTAPEPAETIHDERQGDYLLVDWPTRWADAVQFCRDNADELNERSRDFIAQIAGYQRQPSERQLEWLRHCVSHLQRGGTP